MAGGSKVRGVVVGVAAVCGLALAGAAPEPEAKSTGLQLSERHMADLAEPAAMKRWQEHMTPELAHEFLAEHFVGEWTTTAEMGMGEGQKAKASWDVTGAPMIGGRYVEQRAKGTMMGMPVESVTVFGYDTRRNLFHATMFDSMGTGVKTLWGNLDREGDVLTLVGEMDEPMSGEYGKSFLVAYTFHEDGTQTYEVKEILYGEPFTVVKATSARKE